MNIPLLALFTCPNITNNHHVAVRHYNYAKSKYEFDPAIIFKLVDKKDSLVSVRFFVDNPL